MLDLQQILFWTFSLTMLGTAVLVVTRNSLVNSAMLLLQLFLCMSGLYLLLQAFFLAVIQILVYAGAVVVLFLFVIMLLHPEREKTSSWASFPIAGAGLTFLSLVGAIGYAAVHSRSAVTQVAEVPAAMQGGVRQVVAPIFNHYLLPFQLISLILLAAMVGVIVLSRRDAS
jgi:NADH-quinone oxidoreductase subunit J